MRRSVIFIYIMIPILLFSAGWVVFSRFIRPNHYQLLYPYSGFEFRNENITASKIGKDKKIKIKIPSGFALVGKDTYEETIMIDDFWIDQIPVTAADYKRFLEESHFLAPRYHDDFHKYWDQKKYELLPVVFVSWGQAEDYCEYYGGHLPTEAQWEKAARGVNGTVLYWNDSEKAFSKANYDNFFDGKTPAGWLPAGKTVFGVLDMSGNIREWVMDWMTEPDQPVQDEKWEILRLGSYEEKGRMLKGGSYIDDLSHLRLNFRDAHDPNSPGYNRGFRCVYEN